MASLQLVIIVFLICLCQATILPNLDGNVLLSRSLSPYDAPGDIIIPFGSTVTIESGATLRFNRGAQLIVRGTLLARGTPEQRIRFTSATNTLYHDQQQIHHSSGSNIRFRLVDGSNIQNGLLQMFFKNQWRYVCSEFYRWFDYDAILTCRMMGFRNGSVVPFHINGSETPWYGLQIDHPACRPNLDEHLLDCPGVRVPPQLGIHICDGKQYVRLQCDGFFDPMTVLNWGGIVFERKISLNKLSDIPYISDSASPVFNDLNQQQSILNYVDILHAGLRPELSIRLYAERYAAVTVFDNLINPIFDNITILHSASDGMNCSNVGSSIKLRNSIIAHNRGHGIVVTSRYGNVTLDNVLIHDNAGDGVHYALNNTEWSLREQEESPQRLYKSFCETAGAVEFPSYFTYRPPAAGTCCTQAFSTSYYNRLTVHFQSVFVNNLHTRYRIELYNGQFDVMPLLANITFNRTIESFSSYSNELLVRLCHSCDDVRSLTCWNQSDRIQLYVSNDDGRDADVHIWNSRIVNNSLNGIRIVNLRSLVEINQTIVDQNQKHGLDIDSGAGALWTYHSRFNHNGEDGIHMVYDGGERRIFYSDLSFNRQHGFSVRLDSIPPGFRLSSLYFPTFAYRQTTFINGSSIRSNNYYGLWQRATYHPALFFINGSLFERSAYDAIRFDSCEHEWRPRKIIDYQFRSPMMPFNSLLPPPPPPSIIYQAPLNIYPQYPPWIPVALLYANESGNTILTITWNRFLNNRRVGLRLNPAQNVLGDIANNSFIGHENGALFIGGNQSNWIEDVYLRNVTLRILFNNFTDNLGKHFIVSLNVNELSPYQTILFMYNRLINNNITSKIQQFLNARSRAPGVLTIGSSHIRIVRNVFGNNASQFDIVSQLTNSSATIQADMNFFTSIYPPPATLTRQPLSSIERNRHLQANIQNYQYFQRKQIPLRQISPLERIINRTRRQQQHQQQQQMLIQPFYQMSYSHLTEPHDLRTDFFPADSVFQRPYQPPQKVGYYPPESQYEILSVPSINKSMLLSTTNNDWPYYASPASSTPYFFSLYYDQPELCFSQWPKIRERIFDQHNRSNLASILWYPFLCSDRDITTEIWRCQLPNCGFETTSFRIDPLTSTIGGIIDMDYNLSPGRYIVTNDIVIKPDKRLTIQSSQLEFVNGVGMFVYGELIVTGSDGSPTRFHLFQNQTSTSLLVNQQKQQEQSQRRVMLIDGPNMYQGRLFVTSATDGSGTVCNHGWTRENSILVCASLGFIYDPNESFYSIINPNKTLINDPIIWSEVQCDLNQDETLEQCRKEIVHTCDHNDDVWIKCLPASWAGIHVHPTSSKIHLEYVHFDSAGQYDVHQNDIHAALHIDLFAHTSNRLKNLTFTNNIIGLEISHIHPANLPSSIIQHSLFSQNSFAGLYLHSSFVNISHCTFTHNLYSGLRFDSSYSYKQLESFRTNLHRQRTNIQMVDLLYDQSFDLERNRFVFLTTTFGGYNAEDNILFNTLNIRTDPSYILVIDLIDYNPLSNLNEQLIICEVECFQRQGLRQSLSYKKWSLANDRDLFPLITSYSNLQLHYRLYRYRSSRLTFIVYSIPAPIFTQGRMLSDISLRFHRCLFSYNQHDIHYYFNDREKTNNQFALTNQYKTDIERLLDQLLLDPNMQNTDPSLNLIENEEQKIREEFRREILEDKRLHRRISIIDIKRRYKNATIQIDQCLFEFNQNRSLFIEHQSKQLSSDKNQENIRMLNNETIQQRKVFLPIQLTIRVDRSIFLNNQQSINLDAHPLIYSDRLIRFEITHTNFTHNHHLIFNLTFPRLYPFNKTIFASQSIWPYFPTRSIYTRSPLIYSIPSHALRIYKSIFRENEHCSIRLTGFHASFNLTNSVFENNINHEYSLVDLRHVEKDFRLDGNRFQYNQIHTLLSFDAHSHAPYHQELLVQSSIVLNQFLENKPSLFSKYAYLPSSCIRLYGSSNVTIQRNLFENIHYNYELISGVFIDTINTTVDATINWWGSDVEQLIRNRILDFTKRSDHALVQWNPFLSCQELSCVQTKIPMPFVLQLNRPLRGPITTYTIIHKRREPYLVDGDLIVMPEAMLTIEPGVELHFAPNTGILVLGDLNATGTPKDPIVMRLANKQFVTEQIANGHNPYQYHFTDQVPFSQHKFNPLIDRLQIRLDIGRGPNEGFIQIYNWTRRDWSYACYDTFSQVFSYRLLCHQLKLPWKNVLAHSDRFYLFDHQQLPIWQEKIDCSGNEPSISSCSFTIEKNLTCSNLFYLSCYDDNLVYSLHSNVQREFSNNFGGQSMPTASPTYESPQAWNGIRFANQYYEEDLASLDYTKFDQSLLRYVLISETNDYQPAIQTIYRTPAIERIHIEHSRFIGYEFLFPKQSILFGYSRITNSLDLAINGLVYYGQSTDEKSTFDILYDQTINGQPFSLLNLCNAHRIVNVKYRLLTYFKYDFDYRTCSKLFCSNNPYKIGIRFFQANLINSTYQNDWIEIHRVNNEENQLIAYLTNGSSDIDWKQLYSVEKGCLRVTIHASSGRKTHGFMSEITLFPVTPFSTKEIVHQISDNVLLGNQQGALKYISTGERSANLYFQSNTLLYNGFYRYNSSSSSINYFLFQNAQRFYFGNNWLSENLGGTYIQCYSQSLSSIFNGFLFNNVFYRNRNDSALIFNGMEMSAFCNLYAMQNAFMYNDAYDRNLIQFDSVVANFSRNQVYNNTAMNILSMIGFEKITAPFPAVEMNSFRNNRAVGLLNEQKFDRTGAVIEVGNPRQIYMFNTFDNWDSRYEMKARMRSFEPNRMESRSVNASSNFWGRVGDVDDIGARIYDKYDNKSLIEVNYYPPYVDSSRLRQGKCDPGWTLDDTLCYIYFGAITTYRIAQEMCSSVDARITRRDTPLNRLVILRSLVRTNQYQGINSDAVPSSGIWLRKDDHVQCRIFNDMETLDISCSSTAAFICEKEQQFDGVRYIIRDDLLLALAGLLLMFILMISFICCWLCKSRQRRKENFHRQNSLRRSVKHEINKQSTLSLHKSNDTSFVKSSTLSTLTNGTTNKLPLSTLSLSSRPLSSATIISDQDLSTSSPAHHDFSLLKLKNHQIPKASTPALSDDMGSQRALVLTTTTGQTDQSSVYSTTTTESASLYRSRRKFERIQTPTLPPTAPPITHRRSLKNLQSNTSVSTGSISPPPAYVSPAHQPRRNRSDRLHLLSPTRQIDSHSQSSTSTRNDSQPPPLETDI